MKKRISLTTKLLTLITISTIIIIRKPELDFKEISIEIEETLDKHEIKNIEIEHHVVETNPITIQLIDKGYTNIEIETIYKNLNVEEINYLLTINYINITEYLKYPYFDFSKIERYISYQNNNHTNIKESIIKVNIGLDYDFYTNIKTIENPENPLVLVNKYNQLPEDYTPNNLINLKCNPKYKLCEEAALAFDSLVNDAKLDKVNIYPYSAYRSYEYQKTIYNKYVNRDGQELADTYSARPGHSEHQTGLSVDIKSLGHNEITESDYAWLKENAHLYGYIIRYPKDSTKITGYQEEPWHLRYVGIEVASEIKNLNITFDEYYIIKQLNSNEAEKKLVTASNKQIKKVI